MTRHAPAAAVALLFCSLVSAQQEEDGNTTASKSWRVSGFGSLGFTHSYSDSGGFLRRDTAQSFPNGSTSWRNDTRLGVQVNYTFSPEFEGVVQLVAKDRAGSTALSHPVQWAFLAYRPTPNWTIRVGRTASDAYLLSDYRHVGFAYTPARPSVEFYGQLPLEGGDGVDITKTWHHGEAQWKLKGSLTNTQVHLASRNISTLETKLRKLTALTLSREDEGLTFRATLARGRIDFQSDDLVNLYSALDTVKQLPIPSVAQQASQLQEWNTPSNVQTIYQSVGAFYDRHPWIASTEYMRTQVMPSNNSFQTAYGLVGRRIQSFTVYGMVGRSKPLTPAISTPDWLTPLTPVLGPAAAAQLQQLATAGTLAADAGRIDQTSLSVGVRWDLHPQAALKVQWGHTRVHPNGAALTGGSLNGGRVNTGTVVLDFVY